MHPYDGVAPTQHFVVANMKTFHVLKAPLEGFRIDLARPGRLLMDLWKNLSMYDDVWQLLSSALIKMPWPVLRMPLLCSQSL